MTNISDCSISKRNTKELNSIMNKMKKVDELDHYRLVVLLRRAIDLNIKLLTGLQSTVRDINRELGR